MKKATIVTGNSFYNQNKIFDLSDTMRNRDNCLLPFYYLKNELKTHGFDLATSDIHSEDDADIVLYNEMPKKLPVSGAISKSHLLLFESELIRPDNWDVKRHKHFNKIFTWNDGFVDDKKYYKINFSFELPSVINKEITKKKKLCTLIAGNKRVEHSLELYSKRVEAIRWFERHHPGDFDLYGIGWDRYRFSGSKIIRALNKIKVLTRVLAPKFPSYKGSVEEKKSTLEKYKFAICYENAKDIPGYITEKVFDCFFSGCIPIYWGANNISDHVPSNCYIDKREYSSYKDLYRFLVDMSDDEYSKRLESIEHFLCSEMAIEFSTQHFATVITKQVTK